MSLSIFTHPCQRPESLPLCKVSFSTFPPPTSVTYMSVSSKSGSKTPKSDQAKCHAPFSARKHVGSIMSNMSFHDVMSRHDVMSCHVVTSCHVTSCHVNENMSNMTRHVIIQWSKSSLKIKIKVATPPFHMISMSTKTCHDMSKCHAMLSCQRHVRFNHYKKTGSSGVKGRVRSYSIYIENLKLVGSVQRGSNPDTKCQIQSI